MRVHGGSRRDNKPRAYAADRFLRFAGVGAKVRNFASRRFDESISVSAIGWIRQVFFRLRLRVLGTFLFTFGVYTFVAAVLISVFHENWMNGENWYFGLSLAVLAVPLLVSRGNISTVLLYSHLGSTLCDYLGVRRESLQDDAFAGRVNVAFVLGVLAGTLTLWFSPASIAAWLLAAVGFGIIFAIPENGIMALAVLLLFAGQKSQLITLIVTIVSYLLKLLRGKRSLCFYWRDAFALLVLLTVVGGGILNRSGSLFMQVGVYALFICSYFLVTFILQDFRKVSRIVTALYVGGGVLAAMYLMGFALNQYFAGSFIRDADYLIQIVMEMPVFQQGFASILFMVLIPLAVSGCMRSSLYVSRHTSVFCVIAMTAALVLCSEGPEVLCAGIATVLLFVLYQKRIGYFVLGIFLAAFVLLIHLTGNIGTQLYTYFAAQAVSLVQGLQELYSTVMKLDFWQLFAGSGLASVLSEPFQIQGAGGFYTTCIQVLGLIGLLVFSVFVIVLIGTSLQFYKKTFDEERTMDKLLRFGVVRSPSDMRLGGGAPLCAVVSMLLCGVALPIGQKGAAFELFWLMCGITAAYIKSALCEIEKADQAMLSDLGPDSAAVSLKRKKED